MLSVLFAESADCLAHLVRFYAPAADVILDVTYGDGTLTRRVGIPVIGVDQDETTAADFHCDARSLPFDAASFPVACFDPPYLYGAKAMHMGPIGQKTWSDTRSTWKRPEQLIELSEGIAKELHRVIASEGAVIVKIMDSRFKGKLIRNHDLVTAAFESNGWRLTDQLVYIRTVTGSYVNNKSAQSTHGYYLVFRKA